jgi:hypothetical protein
MTRIRKAGASHGAVQVQNAEHFQDVLASTADAVRSNEDLSAAIPITFTIDAQPDIPRTLTWSFDSHLQITAFTFTITGVGADGVSRSESFTEASGWTGETTYAYISITSIIMSARTGTGVGDTMDIGRGSKIGLANTISATDNVFKVKKNNAHYAAASYTVSATYSTVDVSTGGAIVGGDDFTIWYKSLNS